MNILSKFTTITWNDPLEFICSNYILNKQIIRYIKSEYWSLIMCLDLKQFKLIKFS